MAEDKRYYWIKLKTGFFDDPAIDWLLSQPKGCEYVILYQMLCLKTANTNGSLNLKIGEMIVPYDVNKIVRDTKHFDPETVTEALELYKKLGLICYDSNGSLSIANHNEMVGSESASKEAKKKRQYRSKQKVNNTSDQIDDNTVDTKVDNEVDMIVDKKVDTSGTKCPQHKGTKCPTEYRDKSIEIRDKSIDIEIDKEKEKDIRKSNRFAPPSVDDVRAYCNERHNNVDPERFVDYYESNGWKVGKNKMKDWKATVRSWEHNDYSNNKKQNGSIIHEVPMPAYCAEKDNYTKPSDEPPWKGVERQYNADKMMLIDGMISGDEFRSREANLKAMYKDLTGKELE